MNIANKLVKAKWILVVAGTHREFLDFCEKNKFPITGNGRKARYISSPDRLMGTRNMPYIVIGTAKQRDDYKHIIELMQAYENWEVHPATDGGI